MRLSASRGNIAVGECFIRRPRVILNRVGVRDAHFNAFRPIYGTHGSVPLSRLLSGTIREVGNRVPRLSGKISRVSSRRRLSIPTSPGIHGFSFALISNEICFQRGSHVRLTSISVATRGHVGKLVRVHSYIHGLVRCRARSCPRRVVHARRRGLGHLCSICATGCNLVGDQKGCLTFTSSRDCFLLYSLRILSSRNGFGQGTSVFAGQAVGPRQRMASIRATDRTLTLSVKRGTHISLPCVRRLANGARTRLIRSLRNIVFGMPGYRPISCMTTSRCLSKGIQGGLAITRLTTGGSPRLTIGISTLGGIVPGSLSTTRVSIHLNTA